MLPTFQPRIFISYAREDTPLAESVRDALRKRGFLVFFDSDAMLAGEDFVRRLTDELRKSDAVVALLTAASAASEWCQAEWYYAHARGLTVIPIRAGEIEQLLPSPIRLLQSRTHFLSAEDAQKQKVGDELGAQLDAVRRARRRRAILRLAGLTTVAAAAIAGLVVLANRAEWLVRARERTGIVQKLTASSEPLSGEEIARHATRFDGDEALLGTSLRLASDPYASDPARLNATMLSTDLLRRRKPETRWMVENARWRNGILNGARLADITFSSGSIERLAVRDATLAGVYWGKSLSLGASTFRNVKFNAGGFAGTNAINVEFLDCVFRGTELDITNFGAVRFLTSPPDPAHPNLITGAVCAFENAVILDRSEPAAPGVLDLSTPADEVQFRDVVFTGVRFRGRIRPEWFTNCSFDRCTFPTSLSIAKLEEGGNRVHDSLQADEPLD